MLMRAATVVQVCRFCFKFYCMFYFTCDRSLTGRNVTHRSRRSRLRVSCRPKRHAQQQQQQQQQQQLDGQGRARREAARRRKSECKIDLGPR